MSHEDSTARPLSYPLKQSFEGTPFGDDNSQAVFLDLSDWQTSDSEQRVKLVFDWSLDEFVAIASSMDVGRDIAYNQKAGLVWWYWVRGLVSMTLCDDVADCILASDNVVSSLRQSIVSNGIYAPVAPPDNIPIVNDTFPASARAAEVQSPPANCDLDVLWAGIRELVDRMCDQAKTVLENVTAQSDKFQRVSEFLDTVPIFGGLADALVKQVVDSAQDLLNLFNAYDSINTRDDLACTIFEEVCSECRYPTYDELFNLVGQNALPDIRDLSIATVAVAASQFVLASSAAQSTAWHTLLAIELFVLYADSKFLNLYGKNAIGIMTSLGEDLPSSDWQVLCDGCTAWCYEYDFSLGQLGWTISTHDNGTPRGTYSSGFSATYSTDGANGFHVASPQINFGAPVTFDSIEIVFDINKGVYDGGPTQNALLLRDGADNLLASTQQQNIANGNDISIVYGGFTKQQIRLILLASFKNGQVDGGGSGLIKKVILRGSGSLPGALTTGAECL